MHAISSYRGRLTDTQTSHTHRQDRLQYTAPQLACSVIMWPRFMSLDRDQSVKDD